MKKIKKWLRCAFVENTPLQGYLCHIPHGLFVVLSAIFISWAIALAFTIGFIVFEVNQDWHLRDQAHNDLAGFLVGIVIGSVILLAEKWL